MDIESRLGAVNQGRVETPLEREFQVAIPADHAELFAGVMHRKAVDKLLESTRSGYFPTDTTITDGADPGSVVVILGSRYAMLARRLAVVPEVDGSGETVVKAGLTFSDVMAIGEGLRKDFVAMQMMGITMHSPAEQEGARQNIRAHLGLMDRFLAAGGPDNEMVRRHNQALLVQA